MIDFGRGRRAHLAVVDEGEPIAAVLEAFGITPGIPVVVLVGGAANMESDVTERARVVMRDVVVPVCDEMGAAVVDGGTAAGVMEVIGLERATCRATFPLIGVAAVGTVSLPGDVGTSPERADLDAHHSHFVLVPGTNWGDRDELASAQARGTASANVVAVPWDASEQFRHILQNAMAS